MSKIIDARIKINNLVFIFIICFSIINISLKIKEIRTRIPYWNSKDINPKFLQYLKKEYSRIGWINLNEPDYDYTHDVSFYWFRFLLMPTHLDNRKVQKRIIIKYKNPIDVIRFSKKYNYKIIRVVQFFSIAFMERIK